MFVILAFPADNDRPLPSGGSFEGGASGWALSNAATTSGNDSYYLNSTMDKTSLKLTGSALSPGFCITRDDPLVRLTAKTVRTAGSNGNYSQPNVSIIVKNAAGSQASSFLGSIQPQGNGSWFVLPRIQYGSLFASYLFGADGLGTATMQLQFTVAGQGGTWFLDDIYVDPFAGKEISTLAHVAPGGPAGATCGSRGGESRAELEVGQFGNSVRGRRVGTGVGPRLALGVAAVADALLPREGLPLLLEGSGGGENLR